MLWATKQQTQQQGRRARRQQAARYASATAAAVSSTNITSREPRALTAILFRGILAGTAVEDMLGRVELYHWLLRVLELPNISSNATTAGIISSSSSSFPAVCRLLGYLGTSTRNEKRIRLSVKHTLHSVLLPVTPLKTNRDGETNRMRPHAAVDAATCEGNEQHPARPDDS